MAQGKTFLYLEFQEFITARIYAEVTVSSLMTALGRAVPAKTALRVWLNKYTCAATNTQHA